MSSGILWGLPIVMSGITLLELKKSEDCGAIRRQKLQRFIFGKISVARFPLNRKPNFGVGL